MWAIAPPWIIPPSQWITIAGAIASLVVLEGLLSADNALVLAGMVQHLPGKLQKRALHYGIWGAFIFRFIAVLLATRILDFWQFEVVGGVYLLYIAVHALIEGGHNEGGEGRTRVGRGFWATVVGVELADIAFSIDSILAAVTTANELPHNLKTTHFLVFSVKDWIIYIGGVLGIIAMRYVATLFLGLMKRFPGLVVGAYYLVGWIGVNLVGAGLFHATFRKGVRVARGDVLDRIPDAIARRFDMPSWLYWGGMVAIIAVSLLYRPRSKSTPPPTVESAVASGEDRV